MPRECLRRGVAPERLGHLPELQSPSTCVLLVIRSRATGAPAGRGSRQFVWSHQCAEPRGAFPCVPRLPDAVNKICSQSRCETSSAGSTWTWEQACDQIGASASLPLAISLGVRLLLRQPRSWHAGRAIFDTGGGHCPRLAQQALVSNVGWSSARWRRLNADHYTLTLLQVMLQSTRAPWSTAPRAAHCWPTSARRQS